MNADLSNIMPDSHSTRKHFNFNYDHKQTPLDPQNKNKKLNIATRGGGKKYTKGS